MSSMYMDCLIFQSLHQPLGYCHYTHLTDEKVKTHREIKLFFREHREKKQWSQIRYTCFGQAPFALLDTKQKGKKTNKKENDVSEDAVSVRLPMPVLSDWRHTASETVKEGLSEVDEETEHRKQLDKGAKVWNNHRTTEM